MKSSFNNLFSLSAFLAAWIFLPGMVCAEPHEKWWEPYSADDPHTTFLAHWDESENYDSVAGKVAGPAEPTLRKGPHVYHVEGSVSAAFGRCIRIGQEGGASLGDPSALEYPVNGNYDPKFGTIEMWFRPHVSWIENLNIPCLFRCGNIKLYGGKDPLWFAFQVGSSQQRFHIKLPMEIWEGKSGWTHIAVAYDLRDSKKGIVECYLNGELIQRTDSFQSVGMSPGETFFIGGDGNDNFLANAEFDEFRISNVPCTYEPKSTTAH